MNFYLQTKTQFPPAIFKRPSLNLGLIVVIPACNEPFLLLSLLQLKKCKLPESDVEVIVVIYDAENTAEEVKRINRACFETTMQWAKENSSPRLKFQILYFNELPKKQAGLGLARKIGMDEACWRFEKARNPEGIIACFDADSKCDLNYFEEVENHFTNHQKSQAASIYFEYPLNGPDFPDQHYEAFMHYELHLRYIIQAQRWAGFPHAFHAVGSSMAVRWLAYMKAGGMTKKQVGEDITFLHKFTEQNAVSEINSTRVTLSPLFKERFPYGMQKSILDHFKNKVTLKSYHPEGFIILRQLLNDLNSFLQNTDAVFHSLHPSLQTFLKENDYEKRVGEIKLKSGKEKLWKQDFFKWFNAAMFVQFLEHHQKTKADIDVLKASRWLIDQLGNVFETPENESGCLEWFRQKQREGYQLGKTIKAGKE